MILLDVAFVVGALTAPLVVPLALAVIVACRPAKKTLWIAVGTALLSGLAWFAYWYFWGIAFDYVDTGRPYTTTVEYGLHVSVAVSAACCVMLVFVAVHHVRGRVSDRLGRTAEQPTSQ